MQAIPAAVRTSSAGRKSSILVFAVGAGFRRVLLLGHGNRVAAGETAIQVDVGAALRVERPEFFRRRLAAGRAFPPARVRIGHGSDIGTAVAERKCLAAPLTWFVARCA